MSRTLSYLILFLLLASSCKQNDTTKNQAPLSKPAVGPVELLKNGTFSKWENGRPTDWDFISGAGAGEPISMIEQLPNGVALSGEESTTSWNYLSQRFSSGPRIWYRLHFSATVKDLKLGRFMNCWVGFFFFDAAGKRISTEVADISENDPHEQDLFVQTPPLTAYGEARVFLSRPGRLEVQEISLRELHEQDSFSILVGEMDRRYSHFETSTVDWPSLTARYRERAEAAKDPKEFANIISEMLDSLQDTHVFVTPPGEKAIQSKLAPVTFNIDFKTTLTMLTEIKQGDHAGVTGLANSFGYMAISEMRGEQSFAKLAGLFAELLTKPGLIIDMRGNNGGAEVLGQKLLARLTDQPREYSKVSFRAGISHNHFTEATAQSISPGKEPIYQGKIAVLTGPGCVSSCEGTTMMLKTLPNAKSFGQPTQGASGNPQPVKLPNGVIVTYSRWKVVMPDGTPLEGKGIAPDEVIVHQDKDDPTLKAALSWLSH
jgi:carboxyl-terminal processing protease